MTTLNIRLTRDQKEVNTLSTVLMFGMILGNVVINAAAVGVLTALSGSETFTQDAFIKFTVILALVCVLGGLGTYFLTKELPDSEIEKKATEKTPAIEGLKSLFKNKYWVMQLGNNFLVYLGLYARLAALIYF